MENFQNIDAHAKYDIFANSRDHAKTPHSSPGGVCIIFQGMQKGHVRHQKYVTDKGFWL